MPFFARVRFPSSIIGRQNLTSRKYHRKLRRLGAARFDARRIVEIETRARCGIFRDVLDPNRCKTARVLPRARFSLHGENFTVRKLL